MEKKERKSIDSIVLYRLKPATIIGVLHVEHGTARKYVDKKKLKFSFFLCNSTFNRNELFPSTRRKYSVVVAKLAANIVNIAALKEDYHTKHNFFLLVQRSRQNRQCAIASFLQHVYYLHHPFNATLRWLKAFRRSRPTTVMRIPIECCTLG
ncbi:hypothetical protein TrispH2_004898 [Trichoplax sp. H2]|nr:hypothetical protein TrispH2_004898 [Trichoplax sp. H2]|eukprot:RDD42930.1 hypothetical protein TrispH2_004898 [Trichoplax sp. H2]